MLRPQINGYQEGVWHEESHFLFSNLVIRLEVIKLEVIKLEVIKLEVKYQYQQRFHVNGEPAWDDPLHHMRGCSSEDAPNVKNSRMISSLRSLIPAHETRYQQEQTKEPMIV